jgi:acyl carrier protein
MSGLPKDPNDEVTRWIFESLEQMGFEGGGSGPGGPGPGSHLEDDLGLDSIERVELVAMVSQRAGLPNGGVRAADVHTLADLARRVGEAASPVRGGAG